MDRQRPASGWIRVTPAADTRALNNKIIGMADELAAARPGKEALYRDAITKFQTALISCQGIGLGLFTSGRSSGKPSPGGRPPRSSHAISAAAPADPMPLRVPPWAIASR